jgi:hypothetical protein
MMAAMPRRALIATLAVLILGASCGGDGGSGGTASGSTLPTGLTLAVPTPGSDPPAGVEAFDNLSTDHVDTPVDYPQTPPVGGPHAYPPYWQNCRFYETAVPSEHAVHSMEHGAVWITYSPDLAGDEVGLLSQLAGDHVLVSAFEDLPSPIVASAWGRQLQVESATDVALVDFVEAFEQGPQTPEPGAPCSGGTDSVTLQG